MAQYREGTVSVTANSATVVGAGTRFSEEVSEDDLFNVTGSTAVYSVASVQGDTSLTLDRVYTGASETAAGYAITRDFTPRHNLPYPSSGDDLSAIVARLARTLDALIPAAGQTANVVGAQGSPGDTARPYFAWARTSIGGGFTLAPNLTVRYFGVAITTSVTAPTDPNAYNWTPLYPATRVVETIEGDITDADIDYTTPNNESELAAASRQSIAEALSAVIAYADTVDTTIWKGEWSVGVYAPGDIVVYNGDLYSCSAARAAGDTGSPATDTTAWRKLGGELKTAPILPAAIPTALNSSEVPFRFNRADKTLEVGDYIANPAIDEREVTIGTHTTHGVGFVKGLMGSMDNRRALIDGVEYEITGAFMPPGNTKFRFLFNSAVANFPTGETLQVTHSTPTVTVTFVISAGTVRQYPIGDTTHHGVEWNVPAAFRTFLSGNLGATFEVALLTSDQAVNLKRIQVVQPSPELMNRIACSPIGIKTFLHEGMGLDDYTFISPTHIVRLSLRNLFRFGSVRDEIGRSVGIVFPNSDSNIDPTFRQNGVFQVEEAGIYQFEFDIKVLLSSTTHGLIGVLRKVNVGTDDIIIPSTEAAYLVPSISIGGLTRSLRNLIVTSRRLEVQPEDRFYFEYYSSTSVTNWKFNSMCEIRRIQ